MYWLRYHLANAFCCENFWPWQRGWWAERWISKYSVSRRISIVILAFVWTVVMLIATCFLSLLFFLLEI